MIGRKPSINLEKVKDLVSFLQEQKTARFKGFGIEVEFLPSYEIPEAPKPPTEEQLKYFSAEPDDDVLVRV
tara:strand:- start:559 stop:771 length:213 start_codon:yes stop_codon:yes gene_type:complete